MRYIAFFARVVWPCAVIQVLQLSVYSDLLVLGLVNGKSIASLSRAKINNDGVLT